MIKNRINNSGDNKKNASKILYHFTKADSAFKILTDQKLLPSKVLTCNDPFEMDNSNVCINFKNEAHFSWYCKNLLRLCKNNNQLLNSLISKIIGKNDIEALKIIQKLQRDKLSKNCSLLFLGDIPTLEYFRESTQIYCFSEIDIKSSILLWSHYADKHKGVALEFNFPDSEFSNRLHKVNYDSKNIKGGIYTPQELIEFFEAIGNDREVQHKFFRKNVLSKHYDWKYENEWRFISTIHSNYDTQNPGLSITPQLITAIYIGLNTNENEIERLKTLITNKYPETKIFIPKKDNKFLKINFFLR